ncbi:enoyl-CoA hydratase/isomerase family protein [Blastococcus brunescens]|uniref:Enoyl-CoA hydratase-related protein n=1 Tax=Blastococcus brunescens TaxID=1564165 RepID=A0ABZ1B2V4_9ACTN|nr:enoyl-CoA hydratase-related protein [Blastococcus sp. BMG 8361]WRL64188.1 enoyl-CoA hydratase-related protein [Blastococcus sp. BMG 8361]
MTEAPTTGGLRVEVRDRVGYVTIDRPERRNALGSAEMAALVETFVRFDADDDVWAVVVTGAGDKAFSAGRDLKELAGRDSAGARPPSPMREPMRNPFEVVLECRKPTVAALNGAALGGGLELALACDVRLAADTATLALPEALRGMGAIFGSVMLPRLVPLGIAYDMLYTGRTVTADEAARWGLVNRVVPAADLPGATDEYLRTLLANAPLTIRRYKQIIQSSLHQAPAAALRLDVRPDPYSSEDRVEGVRAFAEKRAPRWRAR